MRESTANTKNGVPIDLNDFQRWSAALRHTLIRDSRHLKPVATEDLAKIVRNVLVESNARLKDSYPNADYACS
jgi:hypothetical protein